MRLSIIPLTILILVGALSSPTSGQNLFDLLPDRDKEWKRIYTDQDSVTEVSIASLILEPNGIFRATFRIKFSKAEKAVEKPDAKYKTRVQTIQFDSRKQTYRVVETNLFDSDGKPVYSSGQIDNSPWRPVVTRGVFYGAASTLSPLGTWGVVSSSEPRETTDVTTVTIELNRFQAGRSTCVAPNYELASMTREEIAKLIGISTTDIQMSAERVSLVKIKCDSLKGASEIHFLIPRSLDRAILLSGGILFNLEK